jgi:transposase
MLEQGAQAFGFLGNLWTRPRVQKLIKEQFGVVYHVSYLSELLAKLGFTRQKPQKKARQQDAEAVAAWQEQRWPELKKSARRKHARPSS